MSPDTRPGRQKERTLSGQWLPRIYLEGFAESDGTLWVADLPNLHERPAADAMLSWHRVPVTEVCRQAGDGPTVGSSASDALDAVAAIRADARLSDVLDDRGREALLRLLSTLRAASPYRAETLMAGLLHGIVDKDATCRELLDSPAVKENSALSDWVLSSRHSLDTLKPRKGMTRSGEEHGAVEFLVAKATPPPLARMEDPGARLDGGEGYGDVLDLLAGDVSDGLWVWSFDEPQMGWDNPFSVISGLRPWCLPLDARHWLASGPRSDFRLARETHSGPRTSFSGSLFSAVRPASTDLEFCVLEEPGEQQGMSSTWVKAMAHGRKDVRVWPKSFTATLPAVIA